MSVYRKYSDLELAALLKDGDAYAYTEIYERYKFILYKHAFRLLGDEEECNDVIQDLFLALWQKRDSLAFKTALSSYLYNSVRNRVFDLITHKKVQTKYLESIRDFMEQGAFVTEEYLRAKELSAAIEREITALPKKMREIFELSRDEELSYKQIAEKLGLSANTVKQQVYNAVKILRAKISSLLTIWPFL
ncbi:RNA polymerase sigma-70 factor [Pedobacter sp. MC2016-14]|uniref:RNA polymerase sigma factor n=1 Tax=Pedobacter sp. MC2016-14 TaxID=2897327 RepID=UPI001E64A4A4|nr:RNA polymerase sigma-70 factor [Pedobacter sp. MC2016-14]MCD0489184.1 RNA polymerase sigma-70 factor [Pedobacter sp. MC2016-14]